MRTRLPAVAAIAFVAMVALSAQNAPRDVDLIVTGGTVVTVDAAGRVIENGAVAIDGADIAAVDTAAAIAKQFRGRETIDASGQIVLPGLINTHTHAPMVLYRGLADDLPLMEWLNNYIFPAESKTVSPEFVRAGTRLAALEMIESGTTTFADMYYFEEEIARETRSAGLRGVLGQTVIQFPVADAKTPADALARAETFINEFKGDPLITPAVAPHAIYTLDGPTLRAARELSKRHDVPTLIHLAESRDETKVAEERRASSPVAYLEGLGFLGPGVVGAHGVWVSDADIQVLKMRNVGISHNPESNMKTASGGAPIPEVPACRRLHRSRHRRRGQQQRPRHVRGDAHRGVARQTRQRGSLDAECAHGARNGHDSRRACAGHGRAHRLARTKEARGSHHGLGIRRSPDTDVRSDLASGLRDSRRRCAEHRGERQGPDARPQCVDARRNGRDCRSAIVGGEGSSGREAARD